MFAAFLLVATALASTTPVVDSDDIVQVADQALELPGSVHFGHSLALRGSRALVTEGVDRVLLFERRPTGWQRSGEWTSTWPGPGTENFGASLALGEEWFFVGAPSAGVGRVYVYARSGAQWSPRGFLTFDDQIPGMFGQDQFGASLAYDPIRKRLAVGVPMSDVGGDESGSVYLYTLQGGQWVLSASLHGIAPYAFGSFGHSLSLEDTTLLVGSPGHVNIPGRVHVYGLGSGGWALDQSLVPTTPEDSRYFGWDVELDGSTLGIGMPAAFSGAGGSAWVFEHSGTAWVQSAQVRPHFTPLPQVGRAIALEGDRLVLGATSTRQSAVFYRQGPGVWSERAHFDPQSTAWATGYDGDIALDGGTLFLGAAETDGPQGVGAVFVFEEMATEFLGESTCWAIDHGSLCTCPAAGQLAQPAGCPGAESIGAILIGTGSTSLTAADLRMTGLRLAKNRPCMLISGPSKSTPLPFGNGLLCIGPPIRRIAVDQSGPMGDVEFNPAVGPLLGATPGTTLGFQIWYRETSVLCSGGFNLSNAFRVTATP